MFGQRTTKGSAEAEMETQDAAPAETAIAHVPNPRAAGDAQVAAAPATRTTAIAPRRGVVDLPGSRRTSSSADSSRDKTLRVGPGLALNGEISSCDVLVIEGKVEAKLNEGKLLEIAETGQFRGSVEIENADIAGRFDGNLVVHGRLTVRSTGRISGMVKYGELEVNAGGQIIGEVQVAGGGAEQSRGGNGFKGAARFAAITDEGDSDERKDQRRSA
ncbi:MAG TPA: polymer-forming cytoskeletal protein [Alphaproteobacteria bacterium]|nr:polymer-forming cytoskeletal protein [Alphaproteobacteria bacterium]